MSEGTTKKVLIVSNSGEGIRQELVRKGFTIVAVIPHTEWVQYIGEMEKCHLVILDEVDQDFSSDLTLDNEEERVLLGERGPLVLVLVRSDDYRLDRKAPSHRRWKVHHIHEPLDSILEELWHANPRSWFQRLSPA
jgi:hypothetical protein